MSWMQSLNELYENCRDEVGVERAGQPTLLPVYHTTQLANIEAVIDTDGNWCRSTVLTDKSDMLTVIPCTEKSAGRTSGLAPHALFDNLQYIAGDFLDYGGEEKKFAYPEYMQELGKWCDFPGAPKKLLAILNYLSKRQLIKDLVADGTLVVGEDAKLLESWAGSAEEKPAIFNSPQLDDQRKAFVRFRVECADGGFDPEPRTWEDGEIRRHFIDYQNNLDTPKDYCYATGVLDKVSFQSPKKIRNAGDGAKLISGNDAVNFTFRGRFDDAGQAMCVSRIATEQAHNALKWLIPRQGSRQIDGQTVVAWNNETVETIPILGDAFDYMELIGDINAAAPYDTAEDYSIRLGKAFAGYREKLKPDSHVTIMGLDSATPGRLSIFYYQEMPEQKLTENIQYWQSTCAWRHSYRLKADGTDLKGKIIFKHVDFYGAPAPKDIAEAAYGTGVSDKLRKTVIERVLPCISQRARFPADIMRQAAERAGKPYSMENWEYRKTLGIACALIKKVRNDKGEDWKMALDKTCTTRSYLFGRLLAYAEKVESYAMYVSGGEARMTNAERMMTRFSQKPAATWELLNRQLISYFKRLNAARPKTAFVYKQEIDEILDMLGSERFTNEKLSEVYLIGYSSQMLEFRNNNKEETKIEE